MRLFNLAYLAYLITSACFLAIPKVIDCYKKCEEWDGKGRGIEGSVREEKKGSEMMVDCVWVREGVTIGRPWFMLTVILISYSYDAKIETDLWCSTNVKFMYLVCAVYTNYPHYICT